jgi:hypothetical protein
VLERAREIQASLETMQGARLEAHIKEGRRPSPQAAIETAIGPSKSKGGFPDSLFSPGDLVLAELGSLDLDKLTPLDALNRLASFKKRLQS